ncbi:interleukin-36 beta [Sturnira hondurensis]|uniref:interleukin-36 beta n=1 Tax=Sturnira hondurensis TaxID=192404 RepID=UPI001879080C|nr:interleukin-36 beta [Sturnira hondurensis]
MATIQSRNTPEFYTIRDSHQMVWVLKGNSLITVPSSSNVKPVVISSLPCKDTNVHVEGKGNLIYLGIMDTDLCLFCAEIEDQPTLQLKEKKIMDLYREDEAQVPFLFLHSTEGSTSTFQSAAYPSWFIATSSEVGQPVILTEERGKTYNTNFFFSSGTRVQ